MKGQEFFFSATLLLLVVIGAMIAVAGIISATTEGQGVPRNPPTYILQKLCKGMEAITEQPIPYMWEVTCIEDNIIVERHWCTLRKVGDRKAWDCG